MAAATASWTLTLPVTAGSSAQYLRNSGSGTLIWADNSSVVVKDKKAAATQGGTFTSGSWQTRVLQTLENPLSVAWASLASNQITLSAGTYLIEGEAPANAVDAHVTRFYNISDSTEDISGSYGYAGSGAETSSYSFIKGFVTIAAQKIFEFQHQCDATKATVGFGRASAYSASMVYTQCKITKIA